MSKCNKEYNKVRETMIQIKSLTKKYEDLTVLKDINIDIPDGCIYGIIGQSGAGKSTLLRCINGLEKYDICALYQQFTAVIFFKAVYAP